MERVVICVRCHQIPERAALLDGRVYCLEGTGPTCFEQAMWDWAVSL
jgi:hypothetical protein